MYAALVEVDTTGQSDRDAALSFLREQIVPMVSTAPGFVAGYWLAPREDGQGSSIVVFETEADITAAAQGMTVGSTVGPGTTIARFDIREVVASA